MVFKYISRSVRLKLILASVLVEVVMLSILLGNSLRIINTTIEDQSKIRTESVTPLLDSALSISFFERDYATLFELLDKLVNANGSEFTQIKVFDEQGKLFAEAFNDKIETMHSTEISAPLTLAGETIGQIKYGLSISSLYQSKSDLLEQSVLIAASEILLTIILLSITSYLLTRHISVLIASAQQISAGDYAVKIPVNSSDEIGILANDFNIMSNAIQDRIKLLSDSSEALLKKTAEFESIFNSIADGVIFVDVDRICVSVNPGIVRMFGYPEDFYINKKLDFLYKDKTIYHYQGSLRFSSDAKDRNDSYEAIFVRKDGSEFTGELLASRVKDKNGKVLGFIGILRDISERKKYEFELMSAKEKAQVTLESIGDAVITTDNAGKVQYLNPVAEELTGWSTDDALNRSLPEVFLIVNSKTEEPIENPVTKVLEKNKIIELSNDTTLISRNGTRYSIEDSAAPIKDKSDNILGVILVFHDVSKARIMADQLSWQATHDSLTGLINRLEFENRLSKLLEKNKNSRQQHTLLYLDLDQLKVVNDTCGHVAGDEMLKQLATRFLNHIRDNDTLARLGGDEFGILLESCPTNRAETIAKNILHEMSQYRFLWLDKTFTTGSSIGLVHFTSESNDTISTLMTAADVACYAAKDAGRNRIHIYKPDDEELTQRHGEMERVSTIQEALENNRFVLYCQPIVNCSDSHDQPHHYEILIRLRDSDGKILPPMSFIPAAERYNLMPDLDRWIIKNVIKQLSSHPLAQGSMVAINLSGNSLSDETFLSFVIDQLQSKSVDPNLFCFEITETAAISNLAHVTSFISVLRKLGCKFSLDDFGSGLSSFTYLKNLNVDFLKIDGAFVKDMKNDEIDRSMVKSINDVGHVMSLKTIAEFVEDKETFGILKELRIDYAQGYYFSEPFEFEKLKSITNQLVRMPD